MSDWLAKLDPATVWAVISDPTGNLVGATLIMAIAILIVLIVLTALTVLIDTGTRPRSAGTAVASARQRRPWHVRVAITLVVVLTALIVLGAAVAVIGTRDEICLRCHERSVTDAAGKRTGAHPGVACRRCHARPGPSGAVALSVMTVRSYGAFAFGQGGDVGDVSSETCLRCHGDVRTGARSVDRVRVSHEEFLGKGFRCVDCHASTGHGAAGRVTDRPRMSLCVLCHDGVKVSAACETCHVGDITGTRKVSMHSYPMVTLGPVRTCRGCHPVDSCTACHGVEMPHSKDFVEKGEVHGPKAAFGRKAVCERCHDAAECTTRCHPQARHPSSAHVPTWAKDHGTDSSQARQEWCRSCHVFADFGCAMCHSGYGPPPEKRSPREHPLD